MKDIPTEEKERSIDFHIFPSQMQPDAKCHNILFVYSSTSAFCKLYLGEIKSIHKISLKQDRKHFVDHSLIAYQENKQG